ncbi:MAG: hydrogenase formation protein HypD, partial [Proteobacteria bacterium]|nr:hydrogenase formation protein HypD [Pseudomonadota bacterium]
MTKVSQKTKVIQKTERNLIDEFRSRESVLRIVEKINAISTKQATIMEICGTHTHSISKYGIRETLPKNINLISGPGCPVCVTSGADIDRIIEFARTRPDVIIATFGDMMRVPGSASTLAEAKAEGADVRVVYSPLNAIEFALKNPEREVLLFAVGFETTSPTVAATIKAAKASGIKNLSALALHKLTPPAMRALIETGSTRIDGFVCPGHVTAITGSEAYAFLADEFNTPSVVAGFEPVDLLLGL